MTSGLSRATWNRFYCGCETIETTEMTIEMTTRLVYESHIEFYDLVFHPWVLLFLFLFLFLWVLLSWALALALATLAARASPFAGTVPLEWSENPLVFQ